MSLLSAQTAEPVPMVIEGNEWVFVLLGVCICFILAMVLFFVISGRYFKKNKNGYPKLTQREKEQEKRLQ